MVLRMKSMTGFANKEVEIGGFKASIVVKSVNSRNLEISLKLPSFMINLEAKLNKLVKSKVNRGKFKAFIGVDLEDCSTLKLNEELLKQYLQIYEKAKEISGLPYCLDNILQNKEIVNNDFSIDVLETPFLECFEQVLEDFVSSTASEGSSMGSFFVCSLQKIEVALAKVEELFPTYREKKYLSLKNNLETVLERELDQNELSKAMAEVAFLMERADITEEVERLKHHLLTFKNKIKEDNCGKSLGFIVQEMQREANTMGSKFSTELAFPYILSIKEEVEKCREMVLNVE